jgi:hypothetical protein
MHRLKPRREHIRILIGALTAILVVVAGLFYGTLILFQNDYLGIMKNLNSSETKAYMRDRMKETYNFTGLLNWTGRNLNWSKESFTRYTRPQEILNQGKGRCGEFTIVYVAACLALGYEARIVVPGQFCVIFLHGFHAWAEVKLNGIWTHVDPSPTPFWNDTSRYKSWNWGLRIGLSFSAFEDGKIEDVTSRYA